MKGFDETLLQKFEAAKKEYDEVFLPEIEAKMNNKNE
jgi:hypothetical protein